MQSQQSSPRQPQWRDEQEQFEASGLTARKFCELRRLNVSGNCAPVTDIRVVVI
jgi:hypothetical protein